MGRRVAIHRTAVVAPDVEIGDDTIVGPFAVLLAPCRVGRGSWIGPHAVVGTTGEHLEAMTVAIVPDDAASAVDDSARRMLDEQVWFGGHGAGVEIGDGTTVREHCSIQQGTEAPTVVGSRIFMQSKCYIAHDVVIGDDARLAPGAMLGGHVWIGHDANIGMSSAIHQRRAVGAGAMVGMHATVVRDVPPYALVKGNPARISGANRVLMRSLGHDDATIADLESGLAHPDGIVPPDALAPDFAAWRARATRI